MLSIVIPTLNEKENIGRLIRILRRQMTRQDEIIVVDGYSKDGTADIARKLGAEVILQKPQGIGGAKTEGARHAKNDILVHLDCDCIPSREHLHKIRHHFRNGDIDIVGGLDLHISDSAFWKFFYDAFARTIFTISRLIHKISGKFWVPANNSSYRKDVFFRLGGFRSVIAEDSDMMRRAPPSKRVKFDASLVVLISDRRFREEGFLRTVLLWAWNDILIMSGRAKDAKGYRKE